MSSRAEQFLLLLKMRGPQPASAFAKESGITGEGARLQLARLVQEGWIETESRSKGVGRPLVLFRLTAKGHARFPDAHAELSAQLLETANELLGPKALSILIRAREEAADKRYAAGLQDLHSLEERLTALAALRTAEGYMAEWIQEADGYYFIENHCPVCRAATLCRDICRSEMNNLSKALGKKVRVERTDHIIDGSRRCAYRIIPQP